MSQNPYKAAILGTERTVIGWTEDGKLVLDDGSEYIFTPFHQPEFDFTNRRLELIETLIIKPLGWEVGGYRLPDYSDTGDGEIQDEERFQYRLYGFLNSPNRPFKFLDSAGLSPDRCYEDIFGDRMPDPRLKVSHVAWFVGIEDPILLQSFRKVVSTNTPEPTHNSTVTLPSKPTPTKIPAARYVFTRSGAVWKVVFDGGTEFHIKNTDGAKYLDHLLHNPNKPFGATELEKIIKSEKSDSREDNSIQWAVNPKAKHFAKANLKELEVLLAKAEEEENSGEIAGLKIEIAQVQAHVGSTKLLHGDGGERARNNIRKAIEKVKKNLAKGGKYEKEFGQHIGRCVHLGFENGYYNAEGKIWG